MNKTHHYSLAVRWTGNKGHGTNNYRSYERSHIILADNKASIECSSDPAFRGDNTKYNPEELFVASLSTCHMLWYLHLCAEAGVIVTGYTDNATGTMTETFNGGGKFTEVVLHPTVTITNEFMRVKAEALHQSANQLCYIANSCNFPIHHAPEIIIQPM